MKYLSGPYGDILFFLVPLQSKGAYSVMAAADDTPLLHFTDSAPPGDLTPPSPGWQVVVWQATATNADICQGFDDESRQFQIYGQPTPALSVPQSGTNTFTIPLTAGNFWTQVVFQIVNTNVASVTPTTPSTPTQLVSVVGLAMTNVITSTTLNVVGPGAQNSWSPIGTNVTIDILPRGTNMTVALYRVIAATMTNNPPVNVPTQAQLKSYLDSVYGKQADVFFNVLPLTNIVVNYDLNTNGALNLLSVGISAEAAAITNAASIGNGPNVINIYFVNTNALDGVIGTLSGGTYSASRITFIQDYHPNSNVNVTAHEIGHQMGLDKEVGPKRGHLPGNDDRVMWWSSISSNPCRLIRNEWQTVNKKSRGATQ
jgi:hypothetical protein